MSEDLDEGVSPYYEDRVVLFMDFLGFSEIVDEPEMWEAIVYLPKFTEEAERVRYEAIAASLPVASLY